MPENRGLQQAGTPPPRALDAGAFLVAEGGVHSRKDAPLVGTALLERQERLAEISHFSLQSAGKSCTQCSAVGKHETRSQRREK